jgi:NAD(P)-dependent dehydrogenase (short-subunit alcohol dehydrogenase family)
LWKQKLNTKTTAIILGASRGIGLAVVQKLLAESNTHAVCASFRSNRSAEELHALSDRRLHRFQVDITDIDRLETAAKEIAQMGLKPNLVIVTAGILHEPGLLPEKSLRQCDSKALSRLFAVNSIGPLLAARAFIPLMSKTQRSHFAALSAMVGSIEDNRLGGWYGYRASKSALNQFLQTLSIECRRTHPGMCITSIHPGTTDTSLSKPFQGNVEAHRLYSPKQTAVRVLQVVRDGNPEDSGRFVNWDGQQIPY